jgi:diguanylate cyclase (GGDEF)-like protein
MNIFLPKITKSLEKTGKSFIIVFSLFQTAVLGVIDYQTGFEISFAVFYLLPVAMTAWFCERNAALFTSFASAVTWHLSNSLAGEVFSNQLIPIWNTSTRLGFFFITAFLLGKLNESYEHSVKIAGTDFLTGAANPRKFYELVEMEITRSRRYKREFTIIYLDADNFKSINDSHGHHTGSDLLVRVVKVIKQTLRSTDVVGRLGGDEFAVLLPETDRAQAQTAVDKLRSRLLSEMRSEGWAVTFSIGVLTCVESPQTADDVLKLADDLMYEVKKNGKNSAKFKEFISVVPVNNYQDAVGFI